MKANQSTAAVVAGFLVLVAGALFFYVAGYFVLCQYHMVAGGRIQLRSYSHGVVAMVYSPMAVAETHFTGRPTHTAWFDGAMMNVLQ